MCHPREGLMLTLPRAALNSEGLPLPRAQRHGRFHMSEPEGCTGVCWPQPPSFYKWGNQGSERLTGSAQLPAPAPVLESEAQSTWGTRSRGPDRWRISQATGKGQPPPAPHHSAFVSN